MRNLFISEGNRGKHSFIVKRDVKSKAIARRTNAVRVNLPIKRMRESGPEVAWSQRAPLSNKRRQEDVDMTGDLVDKSGADELGHSGRAYDSDHFNVPKE